MRRSQSTDRAFFLFLLFHQKNNSKRGVILCVCVCMCVVGVCARAYRCSMLNNSFLFQNNRSTFPRLFSLSLEIASARFNSTSRSKGFFPFLDVSSMPFGNCQNECTHAYAHARTHTYTRYFHRVIPTLITTIPI